MFDLEQTIKERMFLPQPVPRVFQIVLSSLLRGFGPTRAVACFHYSLFVERDWMS
jgi:hypothetical protein